MLPHRRRPPRPRRLTDPATVIEDCGSFGYRIRDERDGGEWLMAPSESVRRYGGEQTVTVIEERKEE